MSSNYRSLSNSFIASTKELSEASTQLVISLLAVPCVCCDVRECPVLDGTKIPPPSTFL